MSDSWGGNGKKEREMSASKHNFTLQRQQQQDDDDLLTYLYSKQLCL